MEKLFQYKTLQRDNYEILFKSLRRMEIERIWRDDPIFWECRVLHAALSQGSQMRDSVHGTKKHLSWRRTDSITNLFSYEMISLKIICLLLTISQNHG